MMRKGDKIFIRGFDIKDVDRIEEIEKICFSEPWSRESIIESYESELSCPVIAEKDSLLIGYACLYIISKEAHIYSLAVDPKFQGQGIGKKILGEVISRSKSSLVEFISLEVRVSNDIARNFYEKYGFKDVGKRINFYKKPDEDAIIMKKYLNLRGEI